MELSEKILVFGGKFVWEKMRKWMWFGDITNSICMEYFCWQAKLDEVTGERKQFKECVYNKRNSMKSINTV